MTLWHYGKYDAKGAVEVCCIYSMQMTKLSAQLIERR